MSSRLNRVTKSGRASRVHNISAEQLAAHFQEVEEEHGHDVAGTAEGVNVDDGGEGQREDEVTENAAEEEEEDDAEAAVDEMDQDIPQDDYPTGRLSHTSLPVNHGHTEHHQQHFQSQPDHGHHHDAMDHLTAANILVNGNIAYAAAQAVAEHQSASQNHTMPAPQPMVAATDFQPAPPVQMPSQQQPPPQHPQQPQQPQSKSTEQMAHDSGYSNFKIDSAFAKRMARDPAQRIAEQRKHDQDLNLVRRSNVEALFAQISGTEATNSCNHCRKGQGPWTLCVLYEGQMMGSCANCWFNASGSRCSFHEKSQPLPPAHHGYVPVQVHVPVPGHAAPEAIAAGVYGGSPAPVAAGLANAFWQSAATMYSKDVGVQQTLQNALMQVRQADRYQRSLIEVEVAAKQLALKIVYAEELAAAEQQAYASPPPAAPAEGGT